MTKMTENKNAEEAKGAEQENLPAFIKAAPELLPLWDWWVKEGRSTLMMVAIAALAVAGFYGVRNWQRSRNAAANNALTSAFNVDELETAVAGYGSTKAGMALKLRLAKGYYDAERYQDALDAYDALLAAKTHPAFSDIASVGRAYALEGLGRFKDAYDAFAAYAEANPESYLLLTARLGAARCKALQGDKDGAAKDFEALKSAAKDEVEKTRIDRMADAVKRHDPKRAARSLFDAANAAAASVEAEAKAKAAPAKPAPAPAAKPAPAPAAKPAPAPAAKPAPAPAAKPAPAPAAKPAPAPAAKPAAK